jgi:Protein of unknown function (DUF3107)
VEVKIGVQNASRELVVQTASSADKVQRILAAALADGGIFALADDKGAKVLVPADKIAYLELGSAGARRVGFGNAV